MTKQQARQRINQLKKEIWHHSYLYHVLDRQGISDAVWDGLKHELKVLETQFPEFITPDSPTQRVAGRPLDKFQKIRHQVRQWSLNDAFSFEEVKDWDKRLLNIITKKTSEAGLSAETLAKAGQPRLPFEYLCELKIDGLHIVLTYQKGLLKTAATRGDGLIGENVTQNVKTISSIPLKLRQPVDAVVEGEVWMAKDVLAELNRQQKRKGLPEFANPRNAAAGSIRQLDPRVAAARRLGSFIYDLVYFKPSAQATLVPAAVPPTQEQELKLLQKLGFKVNKHFQLCRNLHQVFTYIKKWEKLKEQENYWIDGVVITINQRKQQEQLGYTG